MSKENSSVFEWKKGISLRTETSRFIVRSITPTDVTDAYISWWNDAEIQAGLNSRARSWRRPQALKHLNSFDNINRFHLGIFDKANDEAFIGFFAIISQPKAKIAKTNVVIGDRSYWGKNVVVEVRRHMLDFIFGELDVVKVKGEVFGRNLPSIFNYQALGFTSEGILREELLHFEKGRVDKYVFGLLKAEWENSKKSHGQKKCLTGF